MFEEDKLFGDDLPDVPEKFDHESLKTYAEKMRKHAVDARAQIKALHEREASQAEVKRAVDKMSAEMQALLQQGVIKTERGALGVKDAELRHRYVDETGRMHLKSVRRRVTFAGKSVEVDQPGLFDDTTALTPWHLEVQKAAERRSLVKMFARGNNDTPLCDAELVGLFHRAPANIRGALEKAITDSAGSGAEWIPDGTFPSIYEEFKTPNGFAALFPTVNMPNATMKQPRLSTGVRPYKRSAISGDNPSNYTGSTPESADETISVTDWAVRVVYDEMDAEDAVIAMEPFIRNLVVNALNDGYEDTMVNGDTAASHQDAIASWNLRSRWGSSGLGGTADHRRIFLGLRALAADRTATTDMGSLQTVAGLMSSLIGALGERAASDVVVVVSPEVFYQKLIADTNVITLDKLGGIATLLTGQLAQVFNKPVLVSRWIGADLAATGLYTGSGTLSGALAVDRAAFAHYQRRGVMVEMARDIKTGGNDVVATLRRLFKTPSASTESVVHWGYNWLS